MILPRFAAIVVSPLLAFGLLGCTQGDPESAGIAPPILEPAGSTPAQTAPPTASEVLTQIAAKVPSVKLVKTYTADDDPNKLLGRPNGYTSKVALSDSRLKKEDVEGHASDAIERGGSVEVYADQAGAEARKKFIQTVLASGGLGSEYDYVKGGILVRVTGNLTPSKAKDYEAALG